MTAQDVPSGPRGLPLLGSLLEFRADPLGFVARAASLYGDVVRHTMAADRSTCSSTRS